MIIAVDFDGTLCENAWPEIGSPRMFVINALKKQMAGGARVILWTCREGERLDAAVRWCAEKGIVFDAINTNLTDVEGYYGVSRKVYADAYWDDKSVHPDTLGGGRPRRYLRGRG